MCLVRAPIMSYVRLRVLKNIKKYYVWFGEIILDSEIDRNGDSFWARVLTKNYELGTMPFLENNISTNTVLSIVDQYMMHLV